MLDKNPTLAGDITTITVRSRVRTPNDPPRKPDEYTHGLALKLEPDGTDTLGGAKIYTVWQGILVLLRHIRLLGGLRSINIRFFVNLGNGEEYRFVDMPMSVERPVLHDLWPYLPKLTFEIPRARYGDQLSINSVQHVVRSVGAGLEELHLICTDIEESRPHRRELYTCLCNFVPALRPNITPNLTRFTLTYPSFTPFNEFETRIYPLTLLDGVSNDILSRALRVLSKQLVSFQYYGGRVSSELFSPLPRQRLQCNELPNWPNIQVYIVHFAPITPSGHWMFKPLEADWEDGYESMEMVSDEAEMTATDHDWIDQAFYKDSYYLPYNDPLAPAKRLREYYDGAGVVKIREKPTRLVNDLLHSASNGMVGLMPKIRYWEVFAYGSDHVGLKFDYDEQDFVDPHLLDGEDGRQAETRISLSKSRGRPRLHFDSSPYTYKLPKAVSSPWRKAFKGWKPAMEMAMPRREDIDLEELSLEDARDSASGMEAIRGFPHFRGSFVYLLDGVVIDEGSRLSDQVIPWEEYYDGRCW